MGALTEALLTAEALAALDRLTPATWLTAADEAADEAEGEPKADSTASDRLAKFSAATWLPEGADPESTAEPDWREALPESDADAEAESSA